MGNRKTSDRNFMVNVQGRLPVTFSASPTISFKGCLPIPRPCDSIRLFGFETTTPSRVMLPIFVFGLPQPHTSRGAKGVIGMEVCRWARKALTTPIAALRNSIASLWIFSTDLGNRVASSRTVCRRPALRRDWGIANLALLYWANTTPPIIEITQAGTKFRRMSAIERAKHAITLFALLLCRLPIIFGAHSEQYTELKMVCQPINYDYCKIAEQRLAQEVLAL